MKAASALKAKEGLPQELKDQLLRMMDKKMHPPPKIVKPEFAPKSLTIAPALKTGPEKVSN